MMNSPTDFDTSRVPEDGCYIEGLFIEGSRWDTKDGVLAESEHKVLFTPMPIIWLKPTPSQNLPEHRHVNRIIKASDL